MKNTNLNSGQDNFQLYKRFFNIFKPYTKKIIVIFICIIFSSGGSLLLPVISQQIVDKGLLGGSLETVVKLSVLSFILLLLGHGLELVETLFQSYINSHTSFTLSKSVFKHSLRLKIQYFNNTNFAELMNNTGMDVGNIAKTTDRGTFYIISSAFKIIGGVIGLFIINWKLAVLVFCILPVRYLLVKYLAKKRKSMFESYMKYNQEYSSWYGDTICGIKEIKLLGLERLKVGQFIKKQRSIFKLNIKMALMDKVNILSESVTFNMITSLLYIVGANMVFGNSFTIGGLFAFTTYSVYVIAPVSAILNIGYSFANIIPSVKRLFSFLDMEVEDISKSDGSVRLSKDAIGGNLKFENVSFSYAKDLPVLKNINFEINEGERIAIIGRNGSGKTTLINLLLRFCKPDSGKITIDHIDIAKMEISDYRKYISVVSQELFLFNTSLKENIDPFLKVDDIQMFKAVKDSMAHEFIEALPEKYDTKAGRNGANLSGGEKQKICLARALIRKPKILILDEATSNFDIESELMINKVINNNLKDSTVIIIMHRIEILKSVDRIIMLDGGSISDSGSHEELYKRNKSYKSILDKNENQLEKSII